jgi:microcystin-dependent protein
MDGTIGEIRMFAGNFAPLNWNYCDGTRIAIQTNTALYSILGALYGGDGNTYFLLPDLRGRVPVGVGQGTNLPTIALGETNGAYQHTLTNNELTSHTHTATASVTPQAGTGRVTLVCDPTNAFMGQTPSGTAIYTTTPTANVFMGSNPVAVQIGNTGNSTPFSLMQPYLGMNYVICLYGYYPSRN